MRVTFNRNPVVVGKPVAGLPTEAVKATCGLWHASIEDAVRYGGEVTRHVIANMDLRGDRKHIVVDVKVHMLLPGFMPAIPGWHTDGVPRWDGARWNVEHGEPSIGEQVAWMESGEPVAPRYHLYVSGQGCLTKFLKDPVTLDVPERGADLYAEVSRQVQALRHPFMAIYHDRIIEWDWWTLHTAQKAARREWRYLCRVTETDHVEPQTDLREILRTQEQVYVPTEFGW